MTTLVQQNPYLLHAVLANVDWYKASGLTLENLMELLLDDSQKQFLQEALLPVEGNIEILLQQTMASNAVLNQRIKSLNTTLPS
jgi:hypothetical protein